MSLYTDAAKVAYSLQNQLLQLYIEKVNLHLSDA